MYFVTLWRKEFDKLYTIHLQINHPLNEVHRSNEHDRRNRNPAEAQKLHDRFTSSQLVKFRGRDEREGRTRSPNSLPVWQVRAIIRAWRTASQDILIIFRARYSPTRELGYARASYASALLDEKSRTSLRNQSGFTNAGRFRFGAKRNDTPPGARRAHGGRGGGG